jgi:hypothetical protein
MATQQQTVLRVETNVQPNIATSGNTSVSVTSTSNMTVTGSGTTLNPFTGVTTSTATTNLSTISFTVTGGSGTLYYDIRVSEGDVGLQYRQNQISCFTTHANGYSSGNQGFIEYNTQAESATDAFLVRNFKVLEGDVATFQMYPGPSTGTSRIFAYVVADEEIAPPTIKTFDSLDIYGDIPIKLNKSFAEIQDISKRNSDYSLGIQLPGSKKNNRFFESYFNVDVDSLYFDVTKRVPCQILIDDEKYFEGYMRLNKVNVINSKVEYDVTLYSTVADLFGKIGNNLLNDLDFNDIDFHFNHQFSLLNTMFSWRFNALTTERAVPALWMYPVVHNGYNYTADTNNDAIVDVSGTTQATTRLYTSTVASGYTNYAAFTSAGGLEYRINSPKSPVIDNQLKPGLSVWGLIQLMFKTYGYKIKSDFFNTPWFKLLYVYGIYSSDTTKFSRKITTIEQFPLDGVDVVGSFERFVIGSSSKFYVVKKGTGIPCYCTQAISFRVILINLIGQQTSQYTVNIPALTSGTTINLPGGSPWLIRLVPNSSNVTTSNRAMTYFPQPVGTLLPILDGDNVDFSEIIDNTFKQIDILSSIAKKFDLVFIPDPDVPNQIIIEPYDYYVGTGQIHDWTDKLSYDKGFTVEPALNFIESEIILTDLEDGDDGNKIFKDRNNRVYGENKVTNPTDFKSQTKKIDTIFSPELIRKWDDRVSIPLGINYASQNKPSESGNKQKVSWEYKGIKSKPKLFFFQGIFSPFIDQVGEYYDFGSAWRVNTTYFRLQKSNRTNYAANEFAQGSLGNPVVSHTMPMGNKDENKNERGFNNDSLCILFNSEEPGDIGLGIPTFNTYTENDAYSSFYSNRIDNIYNKNTRFLSGQFDLKLSDIKNLKYNDLIKIKDQYFTVNKISNYNYTNPELTKVELIQSNIEPKTYPDRYFFYQYCSGATTTYKFKTYFNPEENDSADDFNRGERLNSMRRTYFFWSVLYDYNVGALGGNVTGYTSSVSNSANGRTYPYNIREVTKEEYESTGVLHTYDPFNFFFIDRWNNFPSTFIRDENDYNYAFANSGSTYDQKVMFNLGVNCALFNQTANSASVILSPGQTPLPQPTPTPTATPQPTPTVEAMLGSLIMSFDELIPDRGIDNYEVNVNGLLRDVHFTEVDNLYSTNLNPGDVVQITIIRENVPSTASTLGVSRRDYTTDDQGGDMGIRDTFITGVTGTSTSLSVTFTATTIAQDYNFEYRVTGTTYNAATPTPSPSPSSTPTPTPTPTPACNLPLRTINWEFDYSYTSDISTGFTIAEIDMFNYPVTGSCIGKGLEPVNYFTPATYVNYSGLTGGTVFTGSTSFSGQTDGLRNLAIAQNMCYQPSSWPSIMRNGSTVKLYINNIFIKNYDRWETPAGNLYLMDMVQCTGLTQYTRTYIYFDNVTINPNDNVKIVFDDNFITPWQSSQYVYKYNNSADTQRYLTGYTFGDGYYVPQFTQTLTGYTGSYSGTTYITNTSGLTDPQVYIRNSNNDNPDTIVTRTVKWYKDNVVQTAYTLTLTGTTIPKIPSAKTAIYTTFPKPAFGTTNVWEIEDTFVGVPPTPTPTNSPTPTPTATPLPATIAYRYDATSTFSGTTKTASTLTVRFDGNIVHTRSNASYTTSTDTTSTATNIDNGYIGSAITITLNRDLTKSISSSEFVTTRTWFLYINGGLIESINDNTNYNIPITPTVLSQTNSFTPVTLAYGDVVEVRWRDIIVV